MASIRKEIETTALPDDVDALGQKQICAAHKPMSAKCQ